MLPYRDSSVDRPNAAQAAAAYAAGVRAWGGYLAAVVPPGPRAAGGSNLLTSWSQADLDVLRAAGIAPIAFASGWDDPAACGALARAWHVRLMLDCEDGIRGDGPWVDPWLEASGAGLYGLCAVHHHVAPAHIVAEYPSIAAPPATWVAGCPRPTGPLGWQAQGTHVDPTTGLSVDAGWVDDEFGLAVDPPAARRGVPVMSTAIGPTNVDSFAAGWFNGQPRPDLLRRQLWVALAADEAMPGASFPLMLRVWFVPHDYPASGAAESHDVTLQPSQQLSVSPSLAGELSVRIEHLSGGTYVARVYEEFSA